MTYDELVELDEKRLNALDLMIRQKEKIAQVKSKSLSVGDLVWKVIFPMDKKNRAYGKWAPKWKIPFQIFNCYSINAYSIEEVRAITRIITINDKYLK